MVPSPRRPNRVTKSGPASPTTARRASDERRAAVRLREIARENAEARREQERRDQEQDRLDREQQRRDQERADLVYQTTQEAADFEDFVDTRDLRYGTVHPGNVILVDDPIGELFNRSDFTIIQRTPPVTPATAAPLAAPTFGNTGGLGRRPRTTRRHGVSSYRLPPLFFSAFEPSRRTLCEVNRASLTERSECPICRMGTL